MSVGGNDLESFTDGILLEICVRKIFGNYFLFLIVIVSNLNNNVYQSFYNLGYISCPLSIFKFYLTITINDLIHKFIFYI